MATVPHDPDLLGQVLDHRDRLGRKERECGGGETVSSEDESNVADGDETVADEDTAAATDPQTIERDPIIYLEALARSSGRTVGGMWRKVGDCKIIGLGVDPDSYVAASVQLRGTYARTAGVVNTAAAEMFRLPPGWWPASDTDVDTPTGTVRIYSGSGQVVYIPDSIPQSPAPISLDGVSFAAGGGTCPGFTQNSGIPGDDTAGEDQDLGGGQVVGDVPRHTASPTSVTADPTGAGDGRSWDSCDPDPVSAIGPPVGNSGPTGLRFAPAPGFPLTITDSSPSTYEQVEVEPTIKGLIMVSCIVTWQTGGEENATAALAYYPSGDYSGFDTNQGPTALCYWGNAGIASIPMTIIAKGKYAVSLDLAGNSGQVQIPAVWEAGLEGQVLPS